MSRLSENSKRNIIVLIIISLWFINIIHPFIQFTKWQLNTFFSIIILGLPMLLIINSLGYVNKIKKVLIIVLSSFLTCICMMIILIIVVSSTAGQSDEGPAYFEQIRTLEYNDNLIKVYRGDGGATTSYSITVRQERIVIPGIMVVKDLYSEYRQYDVRLQIKDDTLFINNKKYCQLKEHVYF